MVKFAEIWCLGIIFQQQKSGLDLISFQKSSVKWIQRTSGWGVKQINIPLTHSWCSFNFKCVKIFWWFVNISSAIDSSWIVQDPTDNKPKSVQVMPMFTQIYVTILFH